jgi:hypothetical protein
MFQSMRTRGIPHSGTLVTGKPNSNLTSTQDAAWRHYKALRKKLGRAPSVREFMVQLGLTSSGTTQRYINLFRLRRLITPITESKLTLKGKKTR